MLKRRSLLNVATAIIFKIILLFGSFLVRRYLIRFAGNEINGLNSLYLSIIGALSVVDLGIGEAITFCMYKPIVNGETDKVSSLYNLFRRIYIIIGGIIAIAGCALMPILPYLAKGYTTIDTNLYVTFGLMLVSTVLTYFFSAKVSLMNAYRDNYVSTAISSSGLLLQQVLQILVIAITRSFVCFLACRIMAVLAQWIFTDVITRKKYRAVIENNTVGIDKNTKNEIIKNVKALFMHKIGNMLVNTIDSLIISAFIGVAILGKYSNYTTILTGMTGVIALFFTPLTSTIGHLFVQDKEAFKNYYNFFCAFNFSLGCIFFLGYYSIIDNLITLLFGTGLELSRSISFVITVNYFVQFMRQSTQTFKDASGLFYFDRWKPIAEGLFNLVLSIAFVLLFQKIWGDNFAVIGVIVATIITNLAICHVVEPFVLYKHALHLPVRKYYVRNYSYIAGFIFLLIVLDFCMITAENTMIELLINGCIAVGISLIPIVTMIVIDKDFRYYTMKFLTKRKGVG